MTELYHAGYYSEISNRKSMLDLFFTSSLWPLRMKITVKPFSLIKKTAFNYMRIAKVN